MRDWPLIAGLLLTLAFAASLSLQVGTLPVSAMDLWDWLRGEAGESLSLLLGEIRLPRLLLCLMSGFALGVSGVAMQALLRNPLAEPGTLGVASSASLGAVIAFYAGLGSVGMGWGVPLFAMLGCGMAATLFWVLAGRYASAEGLILAGLAISSLCAALVTLMINLMPNPFAVADILFWLMGSVEGRAMSHVWLAAPFVVLGCAVLLWRPGQYDLLGFDAARQAAMGVSLKTASRRVMLGVSLAVGGSVAMCGVIGFVGLIVPHLLRPFVQHQPSRLLVPSGLGGTVLLVLADVFVRIVPTSGLELRLGVITALLGVPLLLWLVWHQGRRP